MEKLINLILLALIGVGACSEKENTQVKNWEILALEKQVLEMNGQNQELSMILKKMNSNHVSIRLFTQDLVNDLENVKVTIR